MAFEVTAIGALLVYGIISLFASRGEKAKRDQMLATASTQ
jgi:hypothetical protein